MQPIDIISIYQKYFDIIDDYFGSIKRYLRPDEDSHIDLGLEIANYPLISDLIFDATEDIDKAIENYWYANLKDIISYVEQQDCLKCVYSGDISPPILENFVKKSALYIDTVILPDPIYNLVRFQKHIAQDNKYYLNKLIRNVFNIWKLRDLILADTKERILLILPINLDLINSEDRSKLIENSETNFVSYVGSLFGQEFVDKESCFEFLNRRDTSRDIFDKIKRYDILPNEFKKFETFNGFLNDLHATRKYTKIRTGTFGDSFGIYLSAQFVRVQEHRFMCQRLNAEPIYDNQLPWFFFNYEIGGLDMDAAIASALQQEKFEWITRVPLPALKIFREENRLEYMRGVIRKGITDLKAKNDKDLIEVSKIIEKNMQEEFRRQASEADELKKEVRSITRKELPITAGGFVAGFIPYLGNIVSLLFASRDIARLVGQKKRCEQIIDEKERSFINLLMKSYEND
jgi:hypothetical protein